MSKPASRCATSAGATWRRRGRAAWSWTGRGAGLGWLPFSFLPLAALTSVGGVVPSVSIGAESPAAAPALSLPQLMSEVLAHSPELQAKAAEIRAAVERPLQVRTPDDPMLMIELWQVPIGAAHIPIMLSLRQPLTWPGKLAARAAVLSHDRARAQAELLTSEKDLRLAAARGYFDYRLAMRGLEVLSAARAIAMALVAAVDVRYRVGRAELAELLAAQESLAVLDNLLLDAGRERDLAQAALNVLRSQPSDTRLGNPTTVPAPRVLPGIDSLRAQALRSRPELLALDAQIAQADARRLAAAKERAPDLALSFSYMATLHPSAPPEHNFTAGVQTSLPSFSLLRAAAQEREALAQRQALQAQRRQREREIEGQLQAALLRAETALRHMRFHAGTLLPLSERSLRAAQAGYQSGRVPLSLLLETARRLVEHQLEFERYQAELGQRLAELEAESGLPLLTGAPAEQAATVGPASSAARMGGMP